jgi:uncharacterized protein
MPAGHGVVVVLACFLTWALLYAPALERSSETQPPGARRTASLIVLRPLAAISDFTRLGAIADAVHRAAGANAGSVQGTAPEPLPVGPAPTGSTAPPVRTTPMRVPGTRSRLRVVVVGDSLAQGLGSLLERTMNPSLSLVSSQGVISSGLSRPDYYDWPRRLQHIENVFHPDLVIVLLGENDAQNLETSEGRLEIGRDTAGWSRAYDRRVRDFVRIAVDNGSHVVWTGIPIVEDHGRWEYIRHVDGIYRSVVSKIPNAAYLDTWSMFASKGGKYTAYLRVGERVVQVREGDGVHFTPTGYTMIARAAVLLAQQQFDLTPKILG